VVEELVEVLAPARRRDRDTAADDPVMRVALVQPVG
jgi:hypothetical protein